MAEVKTHTFNGRKHNIIVQELDGFCDTFKLERTMLISCDLDTRVGLETAIHESLHACNWRATESSVTNTAYDIARFLWRLGYRKVDDGKDIQSKSSTSINNNGG